MDVRNADMTAPKYRRMEIRNCEKDGILKSEVRARLLQTVG